VLGILYLTFQAFPIIFEKHGFNLQSTGLTFLGIGLGMLVGFCTMPYWNRCDSIPSELTARPFLPLADVKTD